MAAPTATICGHGRPGCQERVILLVIGVIFGAQVSGPRAPECHDSPVFPGPRIRGGVQMSEGDPHAEV